MRRGRPIFFLLLAVALLAGGQVLRVRAGLEYDAASLRAWVAGHGLLAPVIFIAMVACRQFLLLPSALLLPAGGLLFGGLMGSILGAIGLTASAAITFALARGIGGDRVRARVARRFPTLDRYIGSAGPLVVFLTVAYPAGVMTAAFWAAGFSTLPVGPLLLAVAAGGLIRAGSYAFFGATLLDVGSPAFWTATVVLGATLLAPLAHPRLRRYLVRPAGPPSA